MLRAPGRERGTWIATQPAIAIDLHVDHALAPRADRALAPRSSCCAVLDRAPAHSATRAMPFTGPIMPVAADLTIWRAPRIPLERSEVSNRGFRCRVQQVAALPLTTTTTALSAISPFYQDRCGKVAVGSKKHRYLMAYANI
jgi:hypothetical protein